MKGRKEIGLDFEIDKLTNSIENVVTGDCFATEISYILENDLKTTSKREAGSLIGVTSSKNLQEMFINLRLLTIRL